MRRAAKTDNNHALIRDGLRKCGYTVEDMSRVGQGIPDLMVRTPGHIVLVEVKQPGEPLTPAEREFFALWDGPDCWVTTSIEDALSRLQRFGR